jgi:hypothetical protein
MTITPENRKRFKEWGCEKVRLDLHRCIDGGCIIEGRDDRFQATKWLTEQGRKRSEQNRKRWRITIWIAALTLIAALIAAAPVIKNGIERQIRSPALLGKVSSPSGSLTINSPLS